jgi:hypothetical protein
MDLLEVFLSRRIQPVQARDHPMWLYSGTEDTTRTHPEEVREETGAQWLRSITGNKDNPRGAKQILPFDADHLPGEVRHNLAECFCLLLSKCICIAVRLIFAICVLQVFTKLYSPVPNGEQLTGEEESEGGAPTSSMQTKVKVTVMTQRTTRRSSHHRVLNAIPSRPRIPQLARARLGG